MQYALGMTMIDQLLAGGPDHRATADLGGAIFGPVDDSEDALLRFQSIADRLIANDGLGYKIIPRGIHKTREYSGNHVDRVVINIPKR